MCLLGRKALTVCAGCSPLKLSTRAYCESQMLRSTSCSFVCDIVGAGLRHVALRKLDVLCGSIYCGEMKE